MFNKQNFCHVASNNRNEQKAGLFVYKTTDNLATVATSGYFNEKIIDINLHDLIIHEWHDPTDRTKVQKNVLCVVERTLENVGTVVIKTKWEEDIETIIAQIQEDFVRKDGTSIMTGPLKMRSSVSFKCAIAPSWDGVGFYKLNDNDSLTLMASMETTDGLCPAANNTYNIGKASYKWKDAYVMRLMTGVINNGQNISVPTTSGTMALTSDITISNCTDTTITSPTNNQVLQYNGTKWVNVDLGNIFVTLTGAQTITGLKTFKQSAGRIAYIINDTIDITNPTASTQYAFFDFHDGQVSSQRLGVMGAYLAPNGHYGAYMQAGNVAGIRVETDGVNTFTSAPTPTDARENSTQIATTAWVKNNFSTYSANCITEIPQDIKLTLSSGTITLKAGSVLYIPNGSGTFTKVTTTSDITASGASSNPNAVRLLYYNNGNLQIYVLHSSGTTPPATGTNAMFYNSSDNTIKRYTNGSVAASGYSFPLALIKDDGTYLYGSIEQVFNGIGYIGSHVFMLPGLSVLTSNGRNADGTLNNIEYTFTSCTVYTRNLTGNNIPLWVKHDGTVSFSSGVVYDHYTNTTPANLGCAQVGTATLTGGVISNFKPKYAFYAVDYNDFQTQIQNIKNTLVGEPNYANQQTITTGFVAPAMGYVYGGRAASDDMSAQININGNIVFYVTTSHGGSVYGNAVVAKGDTITLGSGTYYFVPCKTF